MNITGIQLTNIKNHASSTFRFDRGTTAITGSNGAGKTTVIEAIAWTMFNFLNYTKEDFTRHGEKKGSVRLTFISGLDEREYVIYRDTASGYYVEDPRLKTKVADKKDEVFRFLWQHLGLEVGTDLALLFKHAIGVPQGTFTAIFLEGGDARKRAFDQLLKVEEYREASNKLLATAKFLDGSLGTVREGIARAEGELARSETVKEEHKAYQLQIKDFTKNCANLEHEVAERSGLLVKYDAAEKIINQIAAYEAEQKRLQDSLPGIEQARLDLESLRPKALEQDRLTAVIAGLREKIAATTALSTQVQALDDRIGRLRTSYKANSGELSEAEIKSKDAGDVTALETKAAELVGSIAACQANLDRDKKFQAEIESGLCPIMSAKCLNLKPGETLATFVTTRSSDAVSQITALKAEQTTVDVELRKAREADRYMEKLTGLREREKELAAEGKRLAAEKTELETQTTGLANLEKELAETNTALQALMDPKSRISVLENEVAREQGIRDNLLRVQNDLAAIEPKLKELNLGDNGYDNAVHVLERSKLRESESRLAHNTATLEAAQRRETQLAAEIKHFTELRESLSTELKEKERLEKAVELTKFVRDTLKDAAPRVARNYVHRVSLEANQMFREITGNAEHTLRWTDEYMIVLEEDGFERPFSSLSGGEQMAAALSVRLALLKQLTDIRIAFFDEPTTNMDAERRENLAMQISNITNFDQLFLISHDDTFETYVDKVVSIDGDSHTLAMEAAA